MVLGLPKLFFQFNDSSYDDNDDDNTIGDNTITSDSEGTITKSILRRRNGGRRLKRNTDRNVTWSNTYDTYEENGGGDGHTFETLDTFETRDDDFGGGGHDEYNVSDREEEENLIRDFNFIYPGETDMSYGQTQTFGDEEDTMRSVSVSSEMDGTVELQQMDQPFPTASSAALSIRPMTTSPVVPTTPPPLPPQL